MALLRKRVLLSPIFFKTLLQTCKSNQALHLCWQKIKWVPYLVSSARFILVQRWNWYKKHQDFATCNVPKKCALCLFLLQNGKRTLSGSRIIHTLIWKNVQLSWSVIVLTLNKLALRKSKQPWSQDRMFTTCYKKECNFFMWIDQPISHGIKERLSYSPQPQVTRFHPYGEI